MNQASNCEIPDVQGSADKRKIAINKVGIKDIRHPVIVNDRSDGLQHTVATFNMYVFLPHHFKGTHMSRFVKILNDQEKEISTASFRDMLLEMSELLEADSGHIEMSFPFFVNKKAPVSGVMSLMDYNVTLIGEIRDGETRSSAQTKRHSAPHAKVPHRSADICGNPVFRHLHNLRESRAPWTQRLFPLRMRT
jgi:GTP cyclohydrolase I